MVLGQVIEKVGSIGALWPPKYDSHNQRVKGLHLKVVRDERQLKGILGEAQEVRRANPGATRTTVRAFVKESVLYEGLNIPFDDATFRVEASMPSGNAIEGTRLVYFAHNEPDRMSSDELRRAEKRAVLDITQKPRKTSMQVFSRVRDAGYTNERLDGSLPAKDLDALLRLYKEAYQGYTFVIDAHAILSMTSNGNVCLVARDSTEMIVASMIAEHTTFEVEGRKIDLYELSDYATLKAHEGRGLMAALQVIAARTIRRETGGERAIAHSENRGPWSAVHASSWSAGLSPAQNSKVNSVGLLNKQCTIKSRTDVPGQQGPYEDLIPWVVPVQVM